MGIAVKTYQGTRASKCILKVHTGAGFQGEIFGDHKEQYSMEKLSVPIVLEMKRTLEESMVLTISSLVQASERLSSQVDLKMEFQGGMHSIIAQMNSWESILKWQEKIDSDLEDRTISQQSNQDGNLSLVDGKIGSWPVRDSIEDDIKIPLVSYRWDGGRDFSRKAAMTIDNRSTKLGHDLIERSSALEQHMDDIYKMFEEINMQLGSQCTVDDMIQRGQAISEDFSMYAHLGEGHRFREPSDESVKFHDRICLWGARSSGRILTEETKDAGKRTFFHGIMAIETQHNVPQLYSYVQTNQLLISCLEEFQGNLKKRLKLTVN
ncbi:hypothetical protein ACLOJK_016342 [Asimina triloba]